MSIKKKLKAFSLVEMLITMAIMMLLMLTVGVTFATMVETYVKTDFRIKTRNEVEFITELYKRAIRNSFASNVYLYDTEGLRKIVDYYPTSVDSYPEALKEGEIGNELHLYSTISNRVLCYGFFKDADDDRFGHFVKSSMPIGGAPESCFNDKPENRKNFVIIDNGKVKVDNVDVKYYSSGRNLFFNVVVEAKPASWIGKGESPRISRQLSVQTSVLQF